MSSSSSNSAHIRQSRPEFGIHKTVKARIRHTQDSQGQNSAYTRQVSGFGVRASRFGVRVLGVALPPAPSLCPGSIFQGGALSSEHGTYKTSLDSGWGYYLLLHHCGQGHAARPRQGLLHLLEPGFGFEVETPPASGFGFEPTASGFGFEG